MALDCYYHLPISIYAVFHVPALPYGESWWIAKLVGIDIQNQKNVQVCLPIYVYMCKLSNQVMLSSF